MIYYTFSFHKIFLATWSEFSNYQCFQDFPEEEGYEGEEVGYQDGQYEGSEGEDVGGRQGKYQAYSQVGEEYEQE